MVAISQIEVQTFLTFQILLENLTTNMMYSLRIQGSSESLYSPGSIDTFNTLCVTQLNLYFPHIPISQI